jgi:hypothetical protein
MQRTSSKQGARDTTKNNEMGSMGRVLKSKEQVRIRTKITKRKKNQTPLYITGFRLGYLYFNPFVSLLHS